MDSASKRKLKKVAELTISYYLYEIRYDDIADMEVYPEKTLNLFKKNSKYGFISLQLTTSLRVYWTLRY